MKTLRNLKSLLIGSLLFLLASCSPDTADIAPGEDNVSEVDTYSPNFERRRYNSPD